MLVPTSLVFEGHAGSALSKINQAERAVSVLVLLQLLAVVMEIEFYWTSRLAAY